MTFVFTNSSSPSPPRLQRHVLLRSTIRTKRATRGVPVVDLPDSPEVLDVILRFIYPGVEPPKFTNLTTLSALLSTADKYNIASMWPVLREALKTFIPNESFRAYFGRTRMKVESFRDPDVDCRNLQLYLLNTRNGNGPSPVLCHSGMGEGGQGNNLFELVRM